MTEAPFFTVLVPVYNHASYIGAALDSLLGQTDPDWEAVIINDGSTDTTPEILEDYAKRDPRFRVFHQPNGGVANALNKGLREARGEWICWLSSDDLFDPTKLEIHRAEILLNPECRFFCTHFKTLEEPSGVVEEPQLWNPVPEPQWQVLEMLRVIFVQGNSICVHKEAWMKAGWLNETMRYGQDYDMFLRLVKLFPVRFIPKRTCIQRHHAAQGSQTFREACFFDSAKAAISLLNENSFAELVPLVDLTELNKATQALEKALDIATDPNGFLYGLGPHPALLFRIMEWIWAFPLDSGRAVLLKRFKKRSQAAGERYRGTYFGLIWKAAAAACEVPQGVFAYQQVRPADFAELNYYSLKARHDARAETLQRYLSQFYGVVLSEVKDLPHCPIREIVFVCQLGSRFDVESYGTMRATFEVAKVLQRFGRMVLLVGLAGQCMGLVEGLMFIAAQNEMDLERVVAGLGLLDTVVGISRGDILKMAQMNRAVIYQHGPHPPNGVPPKVINDSGAPVCCVSRDSADAQVSYGIRRELLHVIPNGYDPSIFSAGHIDRLSHSVIFAGNVVAYKGIDIALQAFRIIKQRFPAATFDICGRARSWRGVSDHCLSEDWLNTDGELDWEAIERDLPGCHFRGRIPISELVSSFQSSSVLVLPSRGGDTFGLVSVEAQACGCIPVLPNNGCGFGETMQQGATGHLYSPNTSESLAAAIIGLWEAERPTADERKQAQSWAQSTFSWEKSARSLVNVIELAPRWKGNWRADLQFKAYEARAKAIKLFMQTVPGARRLHKKWRMRSR